MPHQCEKIASQDAVTEGIGCRNRLQVKGISSRRKKGTPHIREYTIITETGREREREHRGEQNGEVIASKQSLRTSTRWVQTQGMNSKSMCEGLHRVAVGQLEGSVQCLRHGGH